MKSFTAIAVFGLAAIVSAQATTDATTADPTSTDVAVTADPTNTEATVTADPTNTDAVAADPTNTDATVTAEPTNTEAATGGNTSSSSSAAGSNTAGAVGTSSSLSGYGGSSTMSPSAYGTGAAGAAVTVTQVVPSFVTYCPGATQFSTNGQTYTATGPGYVTVTNCPCTITSVVGSTPTGPASNYGKGNSTYTGPKYTGAANKVIGASLSVVAAGAAFFAFAL